MKILQAGDVVIIGMTDTHGLCPYGIIVKFTDSVRCLVKITGRYTQVWHISNLRLLRREDIISDHNKRL